MSDLSARLSLPYLLPSQAQKHVTHNEALRRLDSLVHLSLTAIGTETPPPSATEGVAYALGAAPSGDWAGQGGMIALFEGGGWAFAAPAPGWRGWDQSAGELRIWDGTAWVLPPGALGTQDQLGINTSADATNRLAVASDAALFSHDGAGHQLKINKSGSGQTASLLFQTAFTGHAEMGLAGSDDFALKVSADGGAWHTALTAEAASGVAHLPQGARLGAGSAALDAYETGSWTPEIADAASGGAAGSAGSAAGSYVRIGDLVSVSFQLSAIDTTGLGAASTAFIRALPFAAASGSASRFTAPARIDHVTFSTPPLLYLGQGDSAIRLVQSVSGAASSFLDVAALTSGNASIRGSLTYRL